MSHTFRWALLIAGLAGSPALAQAPTAPCCGIVGIDAATGVVTARVTATGASFQFRVTDTRMLRTLRVGQGVFANFRTRQVSVDGATPCCGITSGPTAAPVTPPVAARPPAATPPPPPPAAAPPPPAVAPVAPPARPPAAPPAPAAQLGNVAPITAAMINTLPRVTVGVPVARTSPPARATSRFQVVSVPIQAAGRAGTATLVHLRGLTAVAEAPGLPDGARRLLQMAVRRVPLGESDNYIVDVEMARAWMAARPEVPASVRPTEPREKRCGNWYDSFDCAGQAVSDEWERTFEHATNEWENAKKTVAEVWETSLECFTERTISAGDIPVRFSITPAMTVNLSQSGARGSAQGTVAGSTTIGIPMQSDFAARLDLFYIPCLPFAIRPKSLSASGLLTVGQELDVRVSATGSFNRTYTLPPTGGPSIPIQVFPIIIGGVPVAVLDVSAYIEGNVEVSAAGRADGHFRVTNANPTRFDFSCSGQGCSARSQGEPAVMTTSHSAQIEGTVRVKPAIYTALELNFNFEALSARAGPQPYLLGTAFGCAGASGAQTMGGAASSQQSHALTADLDWGLELRAEALVMGKIVGNSYRRGLMADQHLWFRDVAPGGSTALVAIVGAAGPAVAGQRTDHRIRMPSCYPYTDRVKYQVSWTGGAVPAPDGAGAGRGATSPCAWEPARNRGTCTFDPSREFVVGLVWPTAGEWSLTVAPVGDSHDRVFTPAPPPTQVKVTIVPP